MEGDTVLLIDPSRLFREGLTQIFAASLLTVVHQAVGVEEALPFIERLQPKIVLVDLPESGEFLVERLGQIRAAAPGAHVVVLTESIRVNRLAEALSAGVGGYLLKNMSANALHQSLQLVLLGEKVFPTDLARILTHGRVVTNSNPATTHSNRLSDREMQILSCLLDGASNKQIAYELKISDSTVKVHIKAILKKIRVQNRTQAAIWALNHGVARDIASAGVRVE